MNRIQVNKFRVCLLGGALADALGGGFEFKMRQDIINFYGEPGITDFAYAYGGIAVRRETLSFSTNCHAVIRHASK